LATLTFSKFKPKNFIPSTSANFYLELISLGSKISDLEKGLIFLGDTKRLLVKDADVEEGNIEMSSISLMDFYKIEYPKGWQKPEALDITFYDNQNGDIYKFFQNIAKKSGIQSFKGIKPTELHKYSLEVHLIRYNKIGETILDSNFTIYPKSLPKWVNDYENSAIQVFSISFSILDYKLNF